MGGQNRSRTTACQQTTPAGFAPLGGTWFCSPAQKYSKGHYRVKLLEPIALADEYLMEDGKLSFDTLENVQEKRRFKISVSPAA
jgi:hypothetical protein